ncbi:MAG: hypothetical protein V3T30_08820 [Thermodesulfobacteriota bacterium]
MKKIKKIIIALVLLCVSFSLIIAFYVVLNLNYKKVSYTNYDVAIKEGAFGKSGILPEWLFPPSSKKIRSVRNTDQGEQWASFFFNSEDSHYVENLCKAASFSELIFSEVAVPFWWPRAIKEGSTQANERYNYYICDENKLYRYSMIAIDKKKNRTFFWSLGKPSRYTFPPSKKSKTNK